MDRDSKGRPIIKTADEKLAESPFYNPFMGMRRRGLRPRQGGQNTVLKPETNSTKSVADKEVDMEGCAAEDIEPLVLGQAYKFQNRVFQAEADVQTSLAEWQWPDSSSALPSRLSGMSLQCEELSPKSTDPANDFQFANSVKSDKDGKPELTAEMLERVAAEAHKIKVQKEHAGAEKKLDKYRVNKSRKEDKKRAQREASVEQAKPASELSEKEQHKKNERAARLVAMVKLYPDSALYVGEWMALPEEDLTEKVKDDAEFLVEHFGDRNWRSKGDCYREMRRSQRRWRSALKEAREARREESPGEADLGSSDRMQED